MLPKTIMIDPEPDTDDALSPAAMRAMVDNSGVGLFQTALDGSILYVNPPLAQMLGYPDREAMMADNPSSTQFYVDPGDQARLRAGIRAKGRVDGFVCALRRIDGREIWVSEHGLPLHDQSGQVIGFAGSLADVTQLVETQMRLAETEADYRRIFERATEGIYRSSLDGKQLRSNPALNHLNGYDTEAEHLASVQDIAKEWYVDPNRRDEFKRLLDRDGQVQNFESEIFAHKSRRRLWIAENAYLVRGKTGEPLFYEGTVRDITERKIAEMATERALHEAESASRAKTTFLASISHELRTPLNAILGFSELILQQSGAKAADETMRDYVQHIHDSGRHLLALINDILDFARLEARARTLDCQTLTVREVVADALYTVRPLVAAKGLATAMDCPEGVQIHADRRAVHQCLLNVLANAIKFSKEGGSVQVAVQVRDDVARIRVADHGPGMPEALIERVGDPFLMDTSRQTAGNEGTGLGLAITNALVDQMGGRLEIESAEGQGTRVTMVLPLSA